jgi:hypothetical protein
MHLLMKKHCGQLLLPALVFMLAASAKGQTTYGNVRGLALDPQGAVLANAPVALTNQGTKVQRTTSTNDAGEYNFRSLDPGTYTVSVSLPGFKKTENTSVVVQTGTTTTVDVTLMPGGTSETIEVSAAGPLIDTATANGGQLFSEQQLQELPNLGRNPFVFEKLDVAVTPVGDPRYVRAEDQTGQSTISVSGAPIGANNFAVDGIPISQSSGGVTFIPSLEAVSDTKVQANTYDAELGRTGGGMFNSTLKSGTDHYHGVLYGMTRQTPWSANAWFNNQTPYVVNGTVVAPQTPRPDVTTYLYAGAFGGPVDPTHKVRYLDQTFFWIVEEGYRQAQPLVGNGSYIVPSPAELTGDFSGDTGTTLYDPTTTKTVAGVTTRSPLIGMKNGLPTANVIPASYQNQIGVAIANAYPKCTLCTAAYGSNNYFSTDDFKTRSDMYSGKLDHQFRPWWSAAASYVHLATQEPSGSFLHTIDNADGILHRFNDATAFNNVFTLNATTVLTVGYGFNRYYSHQVPYSSGFNQATGFGGGGFPVGYATAVQSKTFPSIFVNGVGTTGANNIASTSTTTAGLGTSDSGPGIQASKNVVIGLSKSVGKQDIKLGYVYRSLNYTTEALGSSGSFTFDGQATTSNGLQIASAQGTGNALADLVLGIPANGSSSAETISLVSSPRFNQNASYHALFVQDNVRLTEKLTVTGGIRYEYELGQRESSNQFVVGFDPNVAYTFPCATAGTCPSARGGLAFAGIDGYPTRCCNQNHFKFSPRVGGAYEIRKGTVAHAGFGVFYAPIGLSTTNTTGFSQTTSSAPSGNITTPIAAGTSAPLSNPFGGAASLLQPSGTSLGPLTGVGGAIAAQAFSRQYPYVQQYSADIEQEIPWGVSLKVGYVGAHSRNFPQVVNINQLPNSLMAQFASGQIDNSTKVANPYYTPSFTNGTTVYPSSGVAANTTIGKGQLLLPYPQFSTVSLTESVGYSLYNALIIKVQKRFRAGLTVLSTYTWSSNWDNFYGAPSGFTDSLNSTTGAQDNTNLKGEYARAVNDIPNRFTLGTTYSLPVGRGKRFLSNSNYFVDLFLGGWEVNDVTIIQNGSPLTFTQTDLTTNFGVSGFGGTVQRVSLVPGVNPCGSGSPQSRHAFVQGNGTYFNVAAFKATPALTYSTMPRTIGCEGPGYANSDISINKTFSVGERAKVQFRAEALNAFNTPEFSNPGLTFGATQASLAVAPGPLTVASTTGKITATAGFARTIQLGARISF